MIEVVFGGSNEDRTRYLIVANDALSQMSYGPRTLKYNKFIFDKNQLNIIDSDINEHFFLGITSVMAFKEIHSLHLFGGI